MITNAVEHWDVRHPVLILRDTLRKGMPAFLTNEEVEAQWGSSDWYQLQPSAKPEFQIQIG